MKRIISTALVCVLLLGCVFSLASCFGPNSDPKEAKAALEEAGYLATLTDNDVALLLAGHENLTAIVTGTKVSLGDGLNYDGVTIYYFEDSDSAEKAYDKIVGEADEKEEEEDTDFEVGKFGKLVWFGTAQAIDAAK